MYSGGGTQQTTENCASCDCSTKRLAYNEKKITKAEDLLSEVITSSNELASNWLYANCLLANNKIEEAKPVILKVLNHNRFEKRWIVGFGFDKVKEHTISLWIDSICATITGKCLPMIDSLAIMVKIDQEIRQTYLQPYKTKATVDSLIKLIRQYGFLTWKLLGEKGSQKAEEQNAERQNATKIPFCVLRSAFRVLRSAFISN